MRHAAIYRGPGVHSRIMHSETGKLRLHFAGDRSPGVRRKVFENMVFLTMFASYDTMNRLISQMIQDKTMQTLHSSL